MAGGIIYSPINELRNLRIMPMPAKPLKDARVLRVPSTDTVVAVDARGNLYSTQMEGATQNYQNLNAGRIRATMDGLAALGAITTKALREHREHYANEARLSSRRHAAECLLDDAQKLGLKMTKTQVIKLELALGGGPRARAIIAGKLGPEAIAS